MGGRKEEGEAGVDLVECHTYPINPQYHIGHRGSGKDESRVREKFIPDDAIHPNNIVLGDSILQSRFIYFLRFFLRYSANRVLVVFRWRTDEAVH